MAGNNGLSDGIDWDSAPPSEDGVYYKILQPRKGGKLSLFIINHQITQATTHYYGSRTRPHFKDHTICEGCKLRVKKRWDGYFACIDPGSGLIFLSHITTNAARTCPQLLNQTKSARGALLVTWRQGNEDRSPMRASIEYRTPAKGLPEPINVRRVLENIWGMNMDDEALPGEHKGPGPSALADFDENGEMKYEH